MQVQSESNISVLVEGQPLKIEAGRKLTVLYSFSYKVADTVSVPLWASLYRYTLGNLDRSSGAQTKTSISLERSIDWSTYQGQVDITPGSIDAGLWGLIIEIPGFEDAGAKIDDCIEIAAAPGITGWIEPLILIAMMGMMAQMAAPVSQGFK